MMLSKFKQSGTRWLPFLLAAIGFLAIPAALGAQSCPLCYRGAAAGGAGFIQALRNGVIVLFFPPLLILGGICYVAYRKRDQFNSAEGPTRIEFEFDEPASKPERPRDEGRLPRGLAQAADTIEL